MSLQMRASSTWWYGRFQQDGKRHCKNLGVPIEGKRPPSLAEQGDLDFELSRARAEQALQDLIAEVKKPKRRANLAKAVYQAKAVYETKTGDSFVPVPLDKLPDLWSSIPRKRPPAPRYASQCRANLSEFIDFLAEAAPQIEHLHQVTSEFARAYLAMLSARGMTAKTWNDRLKLMRSMFKRIPDLPDNPFANIPEREVETVFREPYSPAELEDILEAARNEDVVRPVIITALCTAMRLGDCATLRWSSVDLHEGFITVKTGKTGATVDIPLFPMLEDEINARTSIGGEYVFPDAAEIYLHSPAGLTSRLRKVLRCAGFGDPNKGVLVTFGAEHLLEVKAKSQRVLAELPESRKSTRMRLAFDAYITGQSIGAVAESTGIGKGSVSQYLNEIEELIGMPFIRGKQRKPASRGPVRKEREHGLRRASLRDFHSFRTTWITLALISGIPIDIIRRVTGHKTVDVVVKHYFRPQREELRRVLQESMPKLLTAGMGSNVERGRDLLKQALDLRGEAGWQLVQEARLALGTP